MKSLLNKLGVLIGALLILTSLAVVLWTDKQLLGMLNMVFGVFVFVRSVWLLHTNQRFFYRRFSQDADTHSREDNPGW